MSPTGLEDTGKKTEEMDITLYRAGGFKWDFDDCTAKP